jgi:MFS family permease
VSALVRVHGTALTTANAGLTAFLIAGSLGVLLGGQLADRTRRHDLVLTAGFLVAAALLTLMGLVDLPVAVIVVVMTLVGLANGAIRPSRDMMVRAIAPRGAVGTVFGFVTTGMNVGGALAPVFFGWLIDRGQGALVFLTAAAALLLALGFALWGNRRAVAGAAEPSRASAP